MFTVYVIEVLPADQFIVHVVNNVVSGVLIQGGVTLTLSSGATQTLTSRYPLVVTRAWDALVPNP